ncbi:MAG TPA: ABC transporter permease [Vicinamibacterales bacterium]|nr:ABC transporter permease [Vicinamibacterales bacterium]
MTLGRGAGAILVALWIVAGIFAPFLSPNPPTMQFELPYAPPMRPHVIDADGGLHAPFVYPVRIGNLLERRYEIDRSRRVPLSWLRDGRLATTTDPAAPLLILGADAIGRDVFARLLHGARASLGVALVACLLSLVAGTLIGAAAGYAGGLVDEAFMGVADFLIILPTIYVVLALRAVMPLVLEPWQVFWLLTILLGAVGWPFVARPVRAIVAVESRREYVEAARATGAGPVRIVVRHLAPAAASAIATQVTLLLPAFVLAEATLSFVGLGFVDPTPSWGSMLMDAGRNVRALADFPWLLAPAGALIIFVLGLHVAAAEAGQIRSTLGRGRYHVTD